MTPRASFKRASYLRVHVLRLMRRRGRTRAIVALGHTLLIIVYHVLRTRTPYRDLGATTLMNTTGKMSSARSYDGWSVWDTP